MMERQVSVPAQMEDTHKGCASVKQPSSARGRNIMCADFRATRL